MRVLIIALAFGILAVGAIVPTAEAGPGSGATCRIHDEKVTTIALSDGPSIDVSKPTLECYY